MTVFVYAGAVAPQAYALDITPGDSGVDLSTVSAASFKVRSAAGVESTWTVAITNQTATTLTLTHTLVAGDADSATTLAVYATLTIPSGTVRTATKLLMVKGKFEP